MNSGWISLHRKILKNPVLYKGKACEHFAWIYILLNANYEPSKFCVGNNVLDVKTGQMATSIKGLCKEFGWGNTKVRNFLKKLKKQEMIEYVSTNKLTLLTICNYSTYQNLKYQTNIKQISNKYQTNTSNNTNKENKEIRETKFINRVCSEGMKKTPIIHPDILKEFTNYWTESNPKGRMRFELQKVFDVKRRLSTWIKNKKDWDKSTNSVTGNKSADFPFEPNGYNRMGWCEECNVSDFYDKNRIHLIDSSCCKAKILPKRKEA